MRRFAWLPLIAALSLPAYGQFFGETVRRTGPVNEDLYAAGGTVTLDVDAAGDVVAAGGRVDVGSNIKGDAIVAGGTVEIRGTILDDVRVAGGDVNARARIGGDFIAAGGSVRLAPEATVGARAWIAGGNVDVAGRVARNLRIAAGEAQMAGEVRGDVDVAARKLVIAPGAVIHGNLVYRSDQPATIDPSARIAGTVTRLPAPAGPPPAAARAGAGLLFLGSLMLTAVVLYLAFPAFFDRAARTLSTQPWASLALGLALLVTVPFVTVILFVSLLGLPLGLLLLAAYFIALPVGLLTGIYFVAQTALAKLSPAKTSRTGWRLGAIILACVALALIGLIPVAGALVWLILALIGLGALGITTFRAATAPH